MKRILIVEDEPVIATVYRNKFTKYGFQVEVATDGLEGRRKIREFQPDLVLLDIMLPKINGLDVLKSIRAEPVTRLLPVIVYSNSFTASVTEEARRLGASHLMSKSETRPHQIIELASALLQTNISESRPPVERDTEMYLNNAKQTIADMRQLLSECLRKNDSSMLPDLRHKSRVLSAMAWLADIHRVARLSEGLEALLRTLCDNPQYITFSTDKSLVQTVNCLAELMGSVEEARAAIGSPSVLVVDDEDVAILAAQRALNTSKLASTAIQDPEKALRLLEDNAFDLVLLDIDMPKIDGMTLCNCMRTMPNHKDTPVVFFSQLSEIEYRLGTMAAGGNDFIGKPFLTIELAVKALTWIVKPRAPAASA